MIKIGDIVETCSLMPGIVMKLQGDDIEVRMLDVNEYISDNYSCCSLSHCGIVKLTWEQSLKRLQIGKTKLSVLYSESRNWEDYNSKIDKYNINISIEPYIILSRKGSEVILSDRIGRIWLTNRVKRKKTSKRQKETRPGRSIRYIPIRQL